MGITSLQLRELFYAHCNVRHNSDCARRYKNITQQFRHSLGELAATSRDLLALNAQYKQLTRRMPEGDGSPVLIISGFLGHDRLMSNMHSFLRDIGYRTYGAQIGVNTGLNHETYDQLKTRLDEISVRNNGVAVHVIGHSLGGIYAWPLAHEHPKVRNIISMGSPYGAAENEDMVRAPVKALYKFLNNEDTQKAFREKMLHYSHPPAVPVSALYSQRDGVVHWQGSMIDDSGPLSENIDVSSSKHISMIFNRDIFEVVADRLAQSPGEWRPYQQNRRPELPTAWPA